jgi:hypothetical protein
LLTDKGKILAFDTAHAEDQQLLWEADLEEIPVLPPIVCEEAST